MMVVVVVVVVVVVARVYLVGELAQGAVHAALALIKVVGSHGLAEHARHRPLALGAFCSSEYFLALSGEEHQHMASVCGASTRVTSTSNVRAPYRAWLGTRESCRESRHGARA